MSAFMWYSQDNNGAISNDMSHWKHKARHLFYQVLSLHCLVSGSLDEEIPQGHGVP